MIQKEALLGQDKISSFFDRSIDSGRVPHALIISGEKGSGKLRMALYFAMRCLEIEKEAHPDIRVVDMYEEGVKYTEAIRRQIIDNILMSPYSGKYKFYIINGAERMTKEAQNAILKSLEEPPEYASIIMLTTNPGLLLPTICSRAVSLFIQPTDYECIEKMLMEDHGADMDTAIMCAHLSLGIPKKAVSILENERYLEMAFMLPGVISGIQKSGGHVAYKEQIDSFREEFDYFLELMEIFIRDVLVYKSTGWEDDFKGLKWQQDIKYVSQKSSFGRLGTILGSIATARQSRAANVGTESLMELIVLEIVGGND